MKTPLLAVALLTAAALTACKQDDHTGHDHKAAEKTIAADAGKKAENAKPYPLKVCVVSGEALDSMGKPYVFTHEGQEIKLCCDSCLKDFQKEPAKFLKKIEEAQKKEKK